MMKRFLSCIVLAALLCSLLPGALAEEKITYTAVLQETLNLRKSPSPSAAVLDKVKEGREVEVLSNDGTWCKVKAGNRTGYLMAAHLTMKGSYAHLGWGRTRDDGTVLNLRREADAASPVVYKAMSGGAFELVAQKGEWYQVKIGDVFGYLESSAVAAAEGDFTLGYAGSSEGCLTLNSFRYAPRQVGDPASEEGASGALSFHISYPVLHMADADQKISGWLRQVKAVFSRDLMDNHPGSQGALTVEYQAEKISSRYQSVVLMAEYTVDAWTLQAFLPLNIDAESGQVISPQKIFRKNGAWVLFCLESTLSGWQTVPVEGYAGKPEASWLAYSVLGRNGMEVYLPAGLCLPPAVGSRKVELTYAQLDGCLGLADSFLSAYKRVIDPEKPMIALTFDDGPSEQTDRIVKVLAQYNARATFCVVGNRTESYAAVLKRTVAQGNEIATHTWDHTKLTTLSLKSVRSQLTRSLEAVKDIAGYEIRALRPPYGSSNKNVRSACKELGLFIVTWNIDTLDWQTRNANKTYRAIMKNTKTGNIILMHDLYATTASAVEKAVPELIEKGVQLVTVSELLSFRQGGAEAGVVYSNVDPKSMTAN